VPEHTDFSRPEESVPRFNAIERNERYSMQRVFIALGILCVFAVIFAFAH
jgi:hypothetical protein